MISRLETDMNRNIFSCALSAGESRFSIEAPDGAPEVPQAILNAVLRIAEPGDELFRVVCDSGVEWWLIDAVGELVEGFWLEH